MSDKGLSRSGGLFQGWAFTDTSDKDRFRIRRTELKFAGDILGDNRFKYTIMIDPSQVTEDGTRKSTLQDTFFTLDQIPFAPYHKVDLGQFKLPITEEGLRSSAQLDFAERSFIGRTFGDQRDIGAMVTGDWPIATYQLGVFNGGGQNQGPRSDHRDLAARVVVRPLKAVQAFTPLGEVGQLEMGLSGLHRMDEHSGLAKKRLGYEARYLYKNLALKWEYMFGQDTAGGSTTADNLNRALGWYTQASYTLAPWIPKLQALVRFDRFDPNKFAASDKEDDLTVGLNYFISKHNAKTQLNWVHRDKQGGTANNQILAAFQYAF